MFDIKYVNKNNVNISNILQNRIILNDNLYQNIIKYKNEIDDIDYHKWKIIRSISTDYEIIGNNKIHNIPKFKRFDIISRAYYKLWEILNHFEKTFELLKMPHLRIGCLCEAPGGFIQCLKDYRNNSNDRISGISIKNDYNNIKWNINDLNIEIIYGNIEKNHDGNLYNPEIIKYFINYHKNKLDLITADGGLLLGKREENYKSNYHLQLFLSELYISSKLLKNEGVFIIKIYEINNISILDFMILVNNIYKNVKIFKPKTSREMNNEKYLICYKLKNDIIKYQNKIMEILKKLWENPNYLIIDIFNENTREKYKKLIKLLEKIEKPYLKKQELRLKNAINMKYLTKYELKIILKSKRRFHIKNAEEWYNKNF
jgi:23S rRNA U2552 (ribose-2'-O)-methylase RlmE/FtsJ